jgi:ERCC4-related helicase
MAFDPQEKSRSTARAYQREMYNESLLHNIIVAMDTGSGKTFIAVERIRHELLRKTHGTAHKIAWFMVPGVSLAYQQLDVLKQGLGASVVVKSLTGHDAVDTWSTQQIWDDVLCGVDVIVCTYQILADALRHGFVRLSTVSILVFDEAHHCNGQEPANRIMQDFYHVQKKENSGDLPAILGLSASPVIRHGSGDLM